MSRALNFWKDSILEGYIIEFVVDTITTYSEVEWNFFQGPRGRYLSYLKTWIKMLVREKELCKCDKTMYKKSGYVPT